MSHTKRRRRRHWRAVMIGDDDERAEFRARFEHEVMTDVSKAFDTLFIDFTRQMRARGVSEDAIKGMQIALTMAYRLGEEGSRRKLQ